MASITKEQVVKLLDVRYNEEDYWDEIEVDGVYYDVNSHFNEEFLMELQITVFSTKEDSSSPECRTTDFDKVNLEFTIFL